MAISTAGSPGAADRWEVRRIGTIRSSLTTVATAPRQGREGAPSAWVELEPDVAPAAAEVKPGDELILLTWLHLADRDTLRVHPRDDIANPLTGVFSTRSPDRPNPIGLHPVRVMQVEDGRWLVDPLEAVDGTPVIDVKVALGPRAPD